ncbi:ABC transporter substrate-binding protein [Brevundimonas sp. BAL450]|jgi:galactofuranose transport system substrate-binding protein|uniref:Putative sugar ABC transport system, periplasmic binding protein YtfQ n=1 Tax=Brevundimonas abyssalis TAR-001 TaxID=1391729 RepID=A0A8E0KKZ6_9CAUL|nr:MULTISPECIES: galactofuranose ABC transporter, galactofuranose-binding protein YtfQ [Brevundimonas]MBG7614052.1 ABC transporter substrate-binding protein [Brevundimonas sp. BAL450]GAD58750.1 putative sugar ABC transport system, periplasmic binding protein YtfQ precursor [Brevundimonas abyssalis TAR-001]
MKSLLKLGVAALACAVIAGCGQGQDSDQLVVGFSQIGSESGWRAAETRVAREQAEARGIDLRVSDAQQRQENQIRAIRTFIAQGVDAILLAPVVETGWDAVLAEAREANIPVVLLDRRIETADEDLYLAAVASDAVEEGRVAARWLAEEVGDRQCGVIELQGTVGASVANDRREGFAEIVAGNPNLTIVRSQSGDFTRSRAKEVMESLIRSVGGPNICAVYAHNDDMMIGAIQAMTEAGLNPGEDILTVSIDGVPDIFRAMAEGQANATVELTPNMAGPAFDLLEAYLDDGTAPEKWVRTDSPLYLADTAEAEYAQRRDRY